MYIRMLNCYKYRDKYTDTCFTILVIMSLDNFRWNSVKEFACCSFYWNATIIPSILFFVLIDLWTSYFEAFTMLSEFCHFFTNIVIVNWKLLLGRNQFVQSNPSTFVFTRIKFQLFPILHYSKRLFSSVKLIKTVLFYANSWIFIPQEVIIL